MDSNSGQFTFYFFVSDMSSAASFAFVTYCGLGIGLDGSPRGAARSQRVKVAVAFRGELI